MGEAGAVQAAFSAADGGELAMGATSEAGDAEAQFLLASQYHEGQGVPRDYVRAAALYRAAAEQGHAEAQLELGNMYHDGQGVPQDYVRAAALYQAAAEQGYAPAQLNLGGMYHAGVVQGWRGTRMAKRSVTKFVGTP